MAVEPPTASPIIKRPITNTGIEGANAKIKAPMINIIAIIKTTRRRPSRSDIGPLAPEPTIAPMSIEDTTSPSVKLFSGISSLMKSKAPEITPIS